MHSYREDNSYPLLFSVITLKKDNVITFLAKSEHSIDNFLFSGIRVDRTEKKCNDSPKSQFTVMWHYYLKNINNMPDLSAPVVYGSYEKDRKLKTNTVYTVEVKAKRTINNHFTGKLGFGHGVFVITNQGKVISAGTYPEIEALCEKYSQ